MSIPKDGYYLAKVQLDTGGERQCYVRVKNGKLHDEEGEELLSDACGDFNELSSVMMAWVWPEDAAMELEALRTANAGLVKKVRRLEQAGPIAIQHAFYGRSLSAEQTWKQATKGQP